MIRTQVCVWLLVIGSRLLNPELVHSIEGLRIFILKNLLLSKIQGSAIIRTIPLVRTNVLILQFKPKRNQAVIL